LDELAEKFMEFFLPKDFRAIFSPDDLFPFSAEGIKIVNKTIVHRRPQEEDDASYPPDESPEEDN
jgi:hypothetical protein